MYKILSYVTHTPHQYDVANALHDSEMHLLNYDTWLPQQRPFPSNVFRFNGDMNKLEDFDVAMLHMGGEHRVQYREYIYGKLPVVIIGHGVGEPFMCNGKSEYDPKVMAESCGDYITTLLAKKSVSYWKKYGVNARRVWYGMKLEYPQCQYEEKRAVIINNNFRGSFQWANNIRFLEKLHKGGIHWLQKEHMVNSFEDYKNVLSQYNVYISATKAPNFHRSKADTMHVGMCQITTDAWDMNEVMTENKNAFFVNMDVEEILNLVESLDMNTIKRMGLAARERAREIFSDKAYRKRYLEVIKDAIKNFERTV